MSTTSAPTPDFEVFFDGECPLCVREIQLLRRLDRRQKLLFTDISEPHFDPSSTGKDWQTLMDRIHGRMPDGTVIEGFEVFRQLYTAVGLGWLMALTRLGGISHLCDWSYRLFARNRLKLTGRCIKDAEGNCTLSRPSAGV